MVELQLHGDLNDYIDAQRHAFEDRVKGDGELGAPIPDEELEAVSPVPEVIRRFPKLGLPLLGVAQLPADGHRGRVVGGGRLDAKP